MTKFLKSNLCKFHVMKYTKQLTFNKTMKNYNYKWLYNKEINNQMKKIKL